MGRTYGIDDEEPVLNDMLVVLQKAVDIHALQNYASLKVAVSDGNIEGAREELRRIAQATKYLARLDPRPAACSAWAARDTLEQLDDCYTAWALSV